MLDILVPVLGRPRNAALVAQSIREATTEPYRILFLCSPGDTEQIEACRQVADTHVVDWQPGRADYAKKINLGFEMTDSEWVFQAADDLRFYLGWDVEALRASQRGRQRGVVGTNDLHNPAVRRKMHATHILFRRDYITRYGSGTYDGTGVVLTEAYDHQFVDTEFVETAMARREWVFAVNSRVEHLHPYWGLSARDATYDKAVREAAQDLALYKQRSRLYDFTRREQRLAEIAARKAAR